MASLTLKNVKKEYDNDIIAVDNFNMQIADKEFIVLVGPSGCGKTTMLRMIAGLEEESSGEIYIDDQMVNGIAPKDRGVAMVFQNYSLYPHMTVYENLAFPLKLMRMDYMRINEQVKETAKILDISNLLQRKPKALSGGQRQRVAIGRAIVRQPKVFLMDEPLSNLDARLRSQMRTELVKLHRRLNTTFVYVTHDQSEAMTLGDRLVIMKEGHIQQIGTPKEVYNHPVNIFVAGLIGSPPMNFFSARLIRENDSYYCLFHDVKMPMADRFIRLLNDNNTEEQDVVFGIRPEHIGLADMQSNNTVSAQVEMSEMINSELILNVIMNGCNTILRVPTIGDMDQYRKRFRKGSQHNLVFCSEYIHLFSRKDAKSLYYNQTTSARMVKMA